MGVILALLLLCGNAGQSPKPEPVSLVAEGNPRYTVHNGVIELDGSRGWLRTRSLFLNFRTTFDFKVTAADADPGVLLRTWTGEGGWPGKGFRVRLPANSFTDPSSLLVGYRQPVTVLEHGRIDLRPVGEWQQVEIIAEGPRITVTMNGIRVGVFAVETSGGSCLAC